MQTTGKDKWRIKILETNCVLALVAVLAGVVAGVMGLIWAGVALLIVALFVKPVAEIIASGWLRLAEKIAAINSAILLAMVFYLILSPIALVYRLFNQDALAMDRNDGSTFYVERNHLYTSSDLAKMW